MIFIFLVRTPLSTSFSHGRYLNGRLLSRFIWIAWNERRLPCSSGLATLFSFIRHSRLWLCRRSYLPILIFLITLRAFWQGFGRDLPFWISRWFWFFFFTPYSSSSSVLFNWLSRFLLIWFLLRLLSRCWSIFSLSSPRLILLFLIKWRFTSAEAPILTA